MKPIDDELLADAVTYARDWLSYRQRTMRLPGLAVGIAHGERVLLADAFGTADLRTGTPLTSAHGFRIASHSKMFTASAVMLLQERGALHLDDRLSRWLDWVPEDLGQVTLRQLLSHSAGVIRDGVDTGFWELQRPFPDEPALRALLERAAVVYAPNVRFKYSNFGYSLAGLAVAAASGMPYNEFVRREIVEALGLTSTGPEPSGEAWAQLSRGHSGDQYGRTRIVLRHTDTHAMSAATGFYSTVTDLCRWGSAHFLGNQALLSDESKREMQHEQWRVEGAETGYGLGLITYEIGGRRLVGHTGGFPGFITSTMFDTEQRLVVTVLTNASDGLASQLSAGVIHLINRAQEAGPRSGGRSHFTGRFFASSRTVDVVQLGTELVAVDPEAPEPFQADIRLEVEDEHTLRIAKAPGFASPGEQVAYTFEGSGAPTEVRWAGHRMQADPDAATAEVARLEAAADEVLG